MKNEPFVHLLGDFFPERLELFIFVANELVYLHHSYVSPIVHCYMKPSNILLDQEWVGGKYSDFGAAWMLGVHLQDTALWLWHSNAPLPVILSRPFLTIYLYSGGLRIFIWGVWTVIGSLVFEANKGVFYVDLKVEHDFYGIFGSELRILIWLWKHNNVWWVWQHPHASTCVRPCIYISMLFFNFPS